MAVIHQEMVVSTQGRKSYNITPDLRRLVAAAGLVSGLCNLFVRHTSCSLFLNENADPSVQYDLQNYLNRLVPDHDPKYTHTYEGADDMPAHIKAALLPSSLAIPIIDGELSLGTWQDVYLWEHRIHAHRRRICVTLVS